MRKLNLTFPDEIAQQLSLLCRGQPKICRKESKLGWTSNDRIIFVQQKYFEYYNLHPGFFENDPASLKKKYFKASIRLDLIHEVNFLPKNKIKKNYLQVVFPKKNIILKTSDQNKIEQSEEGNEDEEVQQQQREIGEDKLQKWLFQFPFDVKQFIENKREQEQQKQRSMAKIIPPSPKAIKSERILTPPSKQAKQQHNIQQYVQIIQKTKDILKTKAELAQQQKLRQKKKKQKQLAQIMNSKNQNSQESFSISSFWRQYYKHYENVIKYDQKTLKSEKVEKQIQLLRQVEIFNNAAIKIIRNYVDEYVCGFDQSTKEFSGFKYYQGLWLKIGGKEINQEYLVNYNINDILYSLRQIRGYKFRLPLMSFIKYKGVKVLVMCDMPFSELEKTQVYNIVSQEDMQLMGKLKQVLEIIEDVLNIKSQPLELEPKKKILAPLGAGLKIYQYHFKKDKSQDQATLPNFYYLINPGIIFPIDCNFQRNNFNLMARLRPQLVAFFRDYYKRDNPQLLTQAFMKSTLPEQAKRLQDGKAIEASSLIQTYWIPYLIDRLNSLQFLFVDSYSIKKIMQQIGINIRYLYIIYDRTSLPYIRELILVEVLARTIKKQYRQALSDISLENAANRNIQKTKQWPLFVNDSKKQGWQRYKNFAIDYLNLVFGEGSQSQAFWQIVLYKCQDYFKILTSYPPPVRSGCLLNAVLWHCGLTANFDESINLFKTPQPFGENNEIQFDMRVKTFDFPSFQIQKLFRSAPSLQSNIDFELLKEVNPRLLKMQILFNRTIGNQFQYNTTLAKMSNYRQFLDKPRIKNILNPIFIPYFITNKSQYNFECGMRIFNFVLPQTHPLLISFYLQYSQIFDRELMKKSALLLAVKSLGEFHQKTTQLYSQFYHQGDQQYHVKARRMQTIDACAIICKELFLDEKFESCLNYCMEQITKINNSSDGEKLGTGNYRKYLDMLMQGLESSLKIIQLQKGIIISKQISSIVSSFKLKQLQFTKQLFRKTLIIHMLRCRKKYFLYKLALFALYIRKQHEVVIYDESGNIEPCSPQDCSRILEGISIQYYTHGNHSDWIAFIFATLLKSFQYFNFLEDLFNNYVQHLKRYNSDQFRNCLGYLDLLIRIYGQKLFKQLLYDVRLN